MGNVLEGPRRERRRVLAGGVPCWATPHGEALLLDDGRRIDEATATYLAPCEPGKIIAIHLNFQSRLQEFGGGAIDAPSYFYKPPTALNVHRGLLGRPAGCEYLNYEGELAVVVGRPMRNLAPAETWAALAGFTLANDVGLHDFRDIDRGSMARVKGMDGFCPLGPGLVSGIDVRGSELRTRLNGTVVQRASLDELVFGIDELLADLCRHITLLPGDVVLTGTPAHSRPMQPGDVVEVEVDGVGCLSNTVAEVPAPAHAVGHQPTRSRVVRQVALGSDFTEH